MEAKRNIFDNIQTVDTKDLAKAVASLVAMSLKPEQLNKVLVRDNQGKESYIAPGLITRIVAVKIYNPERTASEVVYVNGDRFTVDLEPQKLGAQLALPTNSNEA